MHCHNCEIELDWDGSSPIIICEICRSYRFTDTPDGTADRIVSLDSPGENFCPCCRRRLQLAAMDGLKVEHCTECDGVLLPSDVLAMYVRNRRTEFRDAASRPVILISEQKQDRHCPTCRREMKIHPCYGPDFIIVESCISCGMVWLDCQEMAASTCDVILL